MKKNQNHYSYVFNADVNYIDSLYNDYQDNPQNVDESWMKFFEGVEFAHKKNGSAPVKTTSLISRLDSPHKEFQILLDQDFKDRKLKENEIIKATVTEITKNFIVVDCKAKMEEFWLIYHDLRYSIFCVF